MGEDEPTIIGVYVRSEFRQKGIGKKLIINLSELSLSEYQKKPTSMALTKKGGLLLKSIDSDLLHAQIIDTNNDF